MYVFFNAFNLLDFRDVSSFFSFFFMKALCNQQNNYSFDAFLYIMILYVHMVILFFSHFTEYIFPGIYLCPLHILRMKQ